MKLTNKSTWLTEEGFRKLYALENQIHDYMTRRLGWTEWLASDDQERRVWNFLDYLEETYVVPTYQEYDRSTTWSTGSISGLGVIPQGVVEYWSDRDSAN